MRLGTRRILAAVWMALVATALLPSRGFGEVRWETDLARASAAARAANRPMLLEFWASWCAPCKAMDAQVFADRGVADAITRVTPVRIDIDRDAHLTRQYEVEATPTLVLTDSYGRELFRHTGLLGVDAVLGLLSEVPGEVTEINRLGEAIARDGDDFAALEGLGHALRAARFYRTSTLYLERALRTRAGRTAGAARRAAVLMAIAGNHEVLQDVDAARRAAARANALLRKAPGRKR